MGHLVTKHHPSRPGGGVAGLSVRRPPGEGLGEPLLGRV